MSTRLIADILTAALFIVIFGGMLVMEYRASKRVTLWRLALYIILGFLGFMMFRPMIHPSASEFRRRRLQEQRLKQTNPQPNQVPH